MTKRLLIAAALAALLAVDAWATGQASEEIHVNGRVLKLYCTPLAPLLEERDDLKKVFRWSATNCIRGYVGTWLIEGDRLYLSSLHREDYDRDARDGRGEYIRTEIPLSVLFSEREGPIPATWFSGALRVPVGSVRQSGNVGFGSMYDRELLIEVVRGRVVSQRTVNQIYENRGRSGKDIQWVALASAKHAGEPVHDDGLWVDARMIDQAEFRRRTPGGHPFVTRGVLDDDEDGSPVLWIPKTLVTPTVWLPLHDLSPWPIETTWPHVEIEVTWAEQEGETSLRVRWLRMLRPGETIHHRGFPVRDLTDAEREKLEAGRENEDPSDPMGAHKFTWLRGGNLLRIEGQLKTTDGVSQVRGLDVHSDPTLEGKTVLVTGVYETWVITERLLALDIDQVEPFRSRGPGTYKRLVEPESGLLVKPTLAPPREAAPKDEQD